MEKTMSKKIELKQSIKLKEKPVYEITKRFLDIFCSVFAIIVLFIPLIIVAVAIYIDDPGLVFFTQTRIGKNGKPFKIYKFRSMKVNAESIKKDLMNQNNGNGANFKMNNDPRITRIGDFIRKTSIDELPQLWNVIIGNMSIIGPRPFIPEEQKELPFDRLLVKPGLSCYWQIGGKNELSKEQQIELDRKYIKERSLLTDIKITLKTFYVVFEKGNK